MPHVTFIHGISNKPAADELLKIWRRALADTGDDPLALGSLGVSSSLVYWASVMYEAPDPDVSAHEGVLENTPAAVDGSGNPPLPMPVSPESAAFIEALRLQLTDLSDAEIAASPQAPMATGPKGLERVPLPWALKKPIMAAFLRDVHHYLFNVMSTPRPGESFAVQEEIRRRTVDLLKKADSRPHIVVSHSMGTVIAYDCLKRVADCPEVDGLITLGSPLGLDEVQDKLRPGWSRDQGFPHEKVKGDWVNVFDSFDVVCGLDPHLAGDYGRTGTPVKDVAVHNPGAWRHSATKYYRQPLLRRELRRMLDV
jgi:pimeloyl-ACP methyl ester carboxylesterase